MKLIQFNRTGFVKFEISDLSLNVTTVDLFHSENRIILLDDLELQTRDEERIPKTSNLLLGCCFFAFDLLMMENTWQGYRNYLAVYTILTALALLFFWHYIVPPKQIHIGVNNDKMTVLYKWRPHKWKVESFLKTLER